MTTCPGEQMVYLEGDVIYERGSQGEEMYIIVSGKVQLDPSTLQRKAAAALGASSIGNKEGIMDTLDGHADDCCMVSDGDIFGT